MLSGHGGVEYEDLVLGKGKPAVRGCVVQIRYDLYLNRGDKIREDELCSFQIGERNVIPGLEYGVEGMCLGGKRHLRIGAHLGYRDEGIPGLIPPNAVLVFYVTLVDLKF